MRPFYLKQLYLAIYNSLSKINKILKFKNFEIYNNYIKTASTEIILGNKEHALIEYLYNNNQPSKTDILENVWGYNDSIETRVLENTVNKIKNKFKTIQIDNFILFSNGKYSINKTYLP